MQLFALYALEQIEKAANGDDAVAFDFHMKVRAINSEGKEYDIVCNPKDDTFSVVLDKTFGQARGEVVNPGS